ncbi:MAG: SPOR domain-containing protein [Candidatus Kapabacteria bacterium]|nr:SPOR domain-containing protein [Candidatus Kapabacteria bacterium]
MKSTVIFGINVAVMITLGVLPAFTSARTSMIRGLTASSHSFSVRDTTDIMNDYDPETERTGNDVRYQDQYRGRSKWSSQQFSTYVDSVGLENRTGQSAAVAHIISSMRQGDMQEARMRLQKLMATPGYMLDPDVAQMLTALDVLLQRDAKNGKAPFMANRLPQRVDTVYRIDTVLREITRVDTVRLPSPDVDQPMTTSSSEPDTVYVDVVKYDTIYIDRQDTTDPMKDLAGSAIPEPPVQPMQSNEGMSPDDAALAGKLDILTDEVLRLRKELRKRNSTLDDSVVTRRCYTIRIASFATRDSAEQTVQRLKKTYKRTRLAIANGAEKPFSVIVGYYQTIRAATEDAVMVSKTTGKPCQPVMTTIAEQL